MLVGSTAFPFPSDSSGVSGNFPIMGGEPHAALKTWHPRWTVPCITGLSQLEAVSFRNLRGFREGEWVGT
jgi:hypothetical protein